MLPIFKLIWRTNLKQFNKLEQYPANISEIRHYKINKYCNEYIGQITVRSQTPAKTKQNKIKFLILINFSDTVETCVPWAENTTQQIDLAFNIFFMVYFFIRVGNIFYLHFRQLQIWKRRWIKLFPQTVVEVPNAMTTNAFLLNISLYIKDLLLIVDHFSSLPPLTSSGSCWSCIPLLTTSPSLPPLSPSTWTGPG